MSILQNELQTDKLNIECIRRELLAIEVSKDKTSVEILLVNGNKLIVCTDSENRARIIYDFITDMKSNYNKELIFTFTFKFRLVFNS